MEMKHVIEVPSYNAMMPELFQAMKELEESDPDEVQL